MSKKTDHELLKSAIADAVDIKKIALDNARLSIRETFEPELKSLLNAQLSEEAEDDENIEEVGLDENELDEKKKAEPEEEEAPTEDEGMDESIDIDAILAEIEKEEKPEDDMEDDMDESKKKDSEEEAPTEDEDDLDEDTALNQLLSELSEGEDEEEAPEEDDDEKVEEAAGGDVIKKITDGIKKLIPDADTLKKVDAFLKQVAQGMQQSDSGRTGLPMEEMQAELNESKSLVTKLVKKVNEGNLITAQLLYMNKIMKECDLSKSEKIKVIKAFDKAGTVNEAKLIHQALASAYKTKETKKTNIKESLGLASKATGTPAKSTTVKGGNILSEAQYDRWSLLAGITD